MILRLLCLLGSSGSIHHSTVCTCLRPLSIEKALATWVDSVVRSVVEVEVSLKLVEAVVLVPCLEVVVEELLAMRELGRMHFVLLVRQERVYVHLLVVEGPVSTVIENANCHSDRDRNRHHLLAVCSAAQMVEGEVSIVRVLEVLLRAAAVAVVLEVQHREEVEAVRMVLKTVEVVEARAARCLELEVLERVTLVVEGLYQKACERREAVSVASYQPVEVVLVSHLYSRPESLQV